MRCVWQMEGGLKRTSELMGPSTLNWMRERSEDVI